MFFSKITIFCVLFLLKIGSIRAQNVGIGTATPSQKLEVAGVVRLAPEAHSGNTLNRILTVDANGDVSANPAVGFGSLDAVTYDISGRVIKANANCQLDLPGPIAGHTLVSTFTLLSTCDSSAEPITVNFKRYGTSTAFAFTYSTGSSNYTTVSHSSIVNIPWSVGCGAKMLTINLNTATNTVTFSVSGAGLVGLYLHKGRSTLFRWI